MALSNDEWQRLTPTGRMALAWSALREIADECRTGREKHELRLGDHENRLTRLETKIASYSVIGGACTAGMVQLVISLVR